MSLASGTILGVGSNYTFTLGGNAHIPHLLTAWTLTDKLTASEAVTYAAAIAAAGYNGIQLVLLEAALTAINQNGNPFLLNSTNPTSVNPAYLADAVPIIQALVNNNMTVSFAVAWGSLVAPPSQATPQRQHSRENNLQMGQAPLANLRTLHL